LSAAAKKLGLSERAYDRVLKAARTWADLADAAEIHQDDMAEAVSFCALDRTIER
jgi:magnesium chelatase family protein